MIILPLVLRDKERDKLTKPKDRGLPGGYQGASLVAQKIKNLPTMQKTQSLSQEDPLEKKMATHSRILAWRIKDRGTWQATVDGMTKGWTQLSNWHFHFFSKIVWGLVAVVINEIWQTEAAAFNKQKTGKKRKSSNNASDDPAMMRPGKRTCPDDPLPPHSDLLPAPPMEEAKQKPGDERVCHACEGLSLPGLQRQIWEVDLRGK